MVVQISLQRGMVTHELFVVDQRRVLAKLLSSFAVAIEELVEARQFLAIAIVLTTIVTIFCVHEGIRVLFYLVANARMVLQIGLQLRMAPHELLVVYQGRILAKLLGGFAVGIEKLIEARHFPTVNAAIVFTAIVTLFLMQESVRILLQLRAKFRMVPQIGLQCG